MFSLLVCFLFAVTHCTNRAYSIATISLTGDVLESLYKADHALSAMKDRKKLSRHYLAAYRLSVGQNVTAFLDTATTVTAIASNDDSASMETVKDKVDEISKCHNKIKACNAIILPLIGTQEVRNEHDKATIVKITDNSELKYNAIEYLLSDYLSDVKINKSLLTQSTGSLLLDAYNECTIESNRNSILTTSAQKMWYLYSNKYRQFKHIRIRLYNYNKEQNKLFYEGKIGVLDTIDDCISCSESTNLDDCDCYHIKNSKLVLIPRGRSLLSCDILPPSISIIVKKKE